MTNRRAFLKFSAGLSTGLSTGLATSLASQAIAAGLDQASTIDHLSEQSLTDDQQRILAYLRKHYSEHELRLLYPHGSLANIQPVVDLITRQTGIRIKRVASDVDNINSYMLLQHQMGETHYDVALAATFGIADLAESNVIQPVDRFKRKFASLTPNYEAALYTLGDQYKGRFYGYQTDGDVYLLFLNKAWLENQDHQQRYQQQYKQPLQVPQTWQALDQQMAFFHQPAQNRFGGCLYRTPRYLVWEWWSRFHAKGFYPVDDQFEPQIDNAAGVAALTEMVQANRYLHPETASLGLFDNWQLFSKGYIYCNLGWGGTQKYLHTSAMRDQLTWAALPGNTLDSIDASGTTQFQTPYFNWGWNYVVNQTAANAELAYLFTLFATLAETSTLAVRNTKGFFDPFASSHYKDPVIQDIYSPAFLDVHQDSLRQSIPDFYVQRQTDYFTSLSENLQYALEGHLSANAAMQLVAKEWRAITRQVGRRAQQSQWQTLKARYPDKLRAVLR